MRGLQHVRRAGVVIHNCDAEDFQDHHLPELPLQLVLLDGFLKFGDRVVVLVCQLPPIGAQLANAGGFVYPQNIQQLLQLIVDFDQVFQIQLHAAIQFVCGVNEVTRLPLVVITRSGIIPRDRWHPLPRLLLVVVLVHLLVPLLVHDFLLLVDQRHIISRTFH